MIKFRYFHDFIITRHQMRLRFTLLFTILSFQSLLGQETFPVNGVAQNFEPIHAFTNAHIVLSPTAEINKGLLLIQGDKIIRIDSNLNIPDGAIIHDLVGDFIYPSFIDLYSDYGLKKAQRGKYNYRPQYDSKKAGAYHWNEAIHPEINASTEWSKYNSFHTKKYYLLKTMILCSTAT